jgi:PAP2 superfamily
MTVRSVAMNRSQPFWPAVSTRLRATALPLRAFGRDFGIVVAVLLVYFVLRGQAPGRDAFAVAVTVRLVDFEKGLHIFWEPAIQAWSIRVHLVQEIANGIYAYGHFPTLALVGGWLWFRGRERFAFMRNTMFISMVIGLAFYYAFPAAPPRLMAAYGYNLGFVDTVFGGHTSVSYAQPSLILNNYAAVPSFHFGWIALASAAVWVNTRNVWARFGAVMMSVVMAWAIVASANHLFVDMALGTLVVALSWYLARRFESYQLSHQAPALAKFATDGEQAA